MKTHSTRRTTRNDSLTVAASISRRTTDSFAAKLAKDIADCKRRGEHPGYLPDLLLAVETYSYRADCARAARRERTPRAARAVFRELVSGVLELP
jgi:hypothetical protein